MFYLEQFSFEFGKVICFGLKKFAPLFFIKSEPIVTRSHSTFSRALRQLHVITSNFDWFSGLSGSFVIGPSDYFGLGFTSLN